MSKWLMKSKLILCIRHNYFLCNNSRYSGASCSFPVIILKNLEIVVES